MFSKKLVRILFIILLALFNIVLLSVSAKHPHHVTIVDRVVMAGIVPFQTAVTGVTRFCRQTWSHYFDLVRVREECERLTEMLALAQMERNRCIESEHAWQRLQDLIGMNTAQPYRMIPAQVTGTDPSGWSHTIMINKGTVHGISKGSAVIATKGLVGHVIKAYDRSAMVLLIVDRTSAVDALVQRTRFRGIVEGETTTSCRFKYMVRKADVRIGDAVISSGLDGLFPKGLRIGTVSHVLNPRTGLFQDMRIRPYVDFSRLEEVLILLESL